MDQNADLIYCVMLLVLYVTHPRCVLIRNIKGTREQKMKQQ